MKKKISVPLTLIEEITGTALKPAKTLLHA